MIFDGEKIESLIAQCRLTEASAMVALVPEARRARAAVAVIAGNDHALARAIEPQLIACRSAADVAAYYRAANLEPDAEDHLVAAEVLAWASDAIGTFDSLRCAYDRALVEKRFYLGVCARERLAHHALIFGDLVTARASIEEAITLARAQGLTGWQLRGIAAAASLALDAGELARAQDLVAIGRAAARSVEEIASFAAVGAQLAVETGDDTALKEWIAPGALEIALRSETADAAVSVTIAVLIAGSPATRDAAATIALRRALFQAESVAGAVALFASAARYGDVDEARFGVESFAATIAPDRPYLHAHHLLARAHFLVKTGERGSWIDSAGDAARAFTAMGLRRWTNDAMRLLVAQEPPPSERRARGRASSLTGREEQVAQLIRRGARNREVAAALQISEHTVERHVSSILGRLGLRSRWQIANPGRGAED